MYRLIIKFKGRTRYIKGEILEDEFLKIFNLQKDNFNLKKVELEREFLILELGEKDSLNNVINELTKLKLNNKKLSILDLNLDIQEIKFEKTKRLLENKILMVEFLTPTLFKVGSNFKGEYSNYLFFSWLLRKFNRDLPKENKITILKEDIEKIIILEKEFESVEIQLNEFITTAFKGKLKLNFKNINSDLINNFETILNYGLKNGVGYKNNNGYGKIKINS
ncbi:CRISPR system precrRNA processing endoribonuclease RAMP protein Cas6 [uncultured Fusobacterium sp.]|uniref:CRISPR system precrRNA processing endoribonuclease RAMP protein Cas6 n=1 Tax=uncultured Fusobacterium sp. TaxID=159267 RepID=UPI0025EDB284|nr:CRISPR system precrRNA processing endoribonuclease RAMP protein Cas6 [uncultured Fusobacterium sp.]